MKVIKSKGQPTQAIRPLNSLRLLRKRRVLVADNDPATSSVLSRLANGDHYEIVAVSDGAEAYRRLNSDADFQAAIINMSMPSIKGLDIVRYMKTENRLKRIPVIVVAGDAGLEGLVESFSAGAVALFPKPFAHEQLWRIVRSVSEQHGREGAQHNRRILLDLNQTHPDRKANQARDIVNSKLFS